MGDLALYLTLAIIGYLVAGRLRKYQDKISFVGTFQTIAIAVLVFTMGSRMGSNEEIIHNLNKIGLYALIFTLIVEVFCLAGVTTVRRALGYDKKAHRRLRVSGQGSCEGRNPASRQACGMQMTKEKACGDGKLGMEQDLDKNPGEPEDITTEGENFPEEAKGSNRMTIIIVVTVVLGMAFGYLVARGDIMDYELFNTIAGNVIRFGLCVLLFLVGFDMGLEGTFVSNIKEAGLRVFAFPAVIIVSTLVASLVCAAIIPLTAQESLAIGGGLAWYSLAPVLIMDAGFMTASAISFMHNVLRELLTLLFAPFVANHLGHLETLALSASGSSDVCLPIIVKSTSSKMALYSFVSGITCSLAVPVLVPLFLG